MKRVYRRHNNIGTFNVHALWMLQWILRIYPFHPKYILFFLSCFFCEMGIAVHVWKRCAQLSRSLCYRLTDSVFPSDMQITSDFHTVHTPRFLDMIRLS